MFSFFTSKKNTASVAKERLKIILAHEKTKESNASVLGHEWLPKLQEEILQVVSKYIEIDKEYLKVNLEKQNNIEFLEINLTLPEAK